MSTEVAKQQKSAVAVTDYNKTAIDYLSSMGLQLPEKYKNQFIELAKAFGLNPFKREIYAVGYGNNFNIITGFEVYLKRAERTGKLDGWNVEIKGKVSDNSLSATITIYRKDWTHPFSHTVYYYECVSKKNDGQPTAIWQKMPVYMTKKVAMAQGFRLCFSDELEGMPYTQDEIGYINTQTVVESKPLQNQPAQNVQPAQQPAAQPTKQVDPEYQAAINRFVELKNTGVFTEQEIAVFKANWKTNWRQAVSDLEQAYALKTSPAEEVVAEEVKEQEPPF